MSEDGKDKSALLIIDMVKDNFDESKNLPITPLARKIIRPLNNLIASCRENEWPIVFATDAYHRQDFIFQGRMQPHSLAGTPGAEVIDELDRRKEDFWLPKPRFSAFFATGLEKWLKKRGVKLCAVAGIATNFCVLTTALDGLSHDFKIVFLEDCTAAANEMVHEQTLNLYRRNPLYPLFKVASGEKWLEIELDIQPAGLVNANIEY